MSKLTIDVWSDIACPWCYIGKRHLEQALAAFPHKDEVEIVWRAFELDPSAPRVRETTPSYAERIAQKYGMPTAQAQSRIDHMVGVAKADGLDFRFDHIKPGNTFDGHRVIHLAHDRGKQDAMKERVMKAYLTEGKAIGEQDVLVELAVDVGLDEQEVRTMLAGERYTREVRQDEALARELGISGVPFFVLAGRLGISGAQPADTLRGALDKAWNDLHKPGIESYADGATCGPDGCS